MTEENKMGNMQAELDGVEKTFFPQRDGVRRWGQA